MPGVFPDYPAPVVRNAGTERENAGPQGMIRGGPDRAEISQKCTLKRINYSLRMARRMSAE